MSDLFLRLSVYTCNWYAYNVEFHLVWRARPLSATSVSVLDGLVDSNCWTGPSGRVQNKTGRIFNKGSLSNNVCANKAYYNFDPRYDDIVYVNKHTFIFSCSTCSLSAVSMFILCCQAVSTRWVGSVGRAREVEVSSINRTILVPSMAT